MSDRDDLMAKIFLIEDSISITSPINASIVKKWPTSPPQGQTITDTPCTMHSTYPAAVRIHGGFERSEEIVRCLLVVGNGDLDQAHAIATAFIDPLIAAFAANMHFDLQHYFLKEIRFNGPQPVEPPYTSADVGNLLLALDYSLVIDYTHTLTVAPWSLS